MFHLFSYTLISLYKQVINRLESDFRLVDRYSYSTMLYSFWWKRITASISNDHYEIKVILWLPLVEGALLILNIVSLYGQILGSIFLCLPQADLQFSVRE